MKILITGTYQGIGNAIANLFLENGHIVIGIDRMDASINHKNYTHYKSDIRDCDSLPEINDINIPTQYCPPHNVYNINAIDTKGFASILVNRLGEIYVNHIQKIDTETSVEVGWIDGYIDYWLETKEETNDE